MTAQSYRNESPRPYGESTGLRLITALESAGIDPFTATDAANEGSTFGLTKRHTLTLLHRLAAGGSLTRIKKGHYATNDPVTKQPRAHPFAIGTALVTPSAISHWSAFQHWGLTEQLPATITLTSSRRTFPPPHQPYSTQGRVAWIVAGTRYEVVAITKARFFGVTHVWINERNRVPIFDRERALLDAFQHFQIFGSLSVGLEALESHLAEIELDRLVQYALQLRVTAVVKRIGWALDRLGVSSKSLAPLRTYAARSDTPLDPGRAPHGRHNLAWHVIENLRDA